MEHFTESGIPEALAVGLRFCARGPAAGRRHRARGPKCSQRCGRAAVSHLQQQSHITAFTNCQTPAVGLERCQQSRTEATLRLGSSVMPVGNDQVFAFAT